MKRAAAIAIFVFWVCVQTPLGQLLKFPFLVEHYLKHQDQEGVTPVDFLKSHYAADHQDADLPEDEQLPFKTIPFNNFGFAILTQVIQAEEPISFPAGIKIALADAHTPQQHSANVFHPPRV